MTGSDRRRAELARLLDHGGDVRDFSLGAARILARSVPFDAVSLVTIDPATHLATSAFVENGLRGDAAVRIAEIEYYERDVNKFGVLARSGRLAASLSAATDGDLDRSLRHRELRAPRGFGDELRAVLVSDAAVWGGLTLSRTVDREPFAAADVALVGSLSAALAQGLRRATVLTAPAVEHHRDHPPAGLALLAADNSISVINTTAEAWLTELGATGPSTPVPPVVTTVASRARSIAEGRESRRALARARVRSPSGTWLTVRGSVLGNGDRALTAVTLDRAGAHELAPFIADAYQLTGRERAVTQLVALGLTTDEIAGRLHISPWTVQDHLRSIFEKVEVNSRGELIARIFFEHYAPRLDDGAPAV
jgi:DNA-binding CsgD family transcriptional regulator